MNDLKNNVSKLIQYKNIEKSYYDPYNEREKIRKENNGKIGVYAWENKFNYKLYIGRGNPLYLRLSDYYQNWYLQSRKNLYIVRSLNKYKMENFNLHILEYASSDAVISCEKIWINLLKPEYNVNLVSGNKKDKHDINAKDKLTSCKLVSHKQNT